MPFGKSKAPVIDPDEWYGKSLGETFGNRHFQLQLVAMMGLHAALYYYFKGNPKSAFHANPNKMGHYVPFLIAFQFMAVYGTYIWLTDTDFHTIDATWGYHPGAETILFSMLAIQSYDTPISMFIPELRQITFVLHHAVVLSLSILSLRYRAFYYYAVYFLGVIELSSPFLAVVDAARDYPKIAEKYPITNEICRVMFAIVFYIVRIFGWFPVSYCFWRDALYLLFNSDAAMHTMPKWVPAFWLFTHGFLTCDAAYHLRRRVVGLDACPSSSRPSTPWPRATRRPGRTRRTSARGRSADLRGQEFSRRDAGALPPRLALDGALRR